MTVLFNTMPPSLSSFCDNKLMNGSSSSSPTSDNNTSSVSTMLESLRSNLSQIYSGESPMETPAYVKTETYVKTESPQRGADFCNDENSFNHQRDQALNGGGEQQFDNIYNPAVTSLSSSTMQRQFSSNPYDTNNVNMINNALFSQQHSPYPTYPLPVKPEPSSPNSPYQLNPYYLSNTQGIYPPSSMNLNQIDYQGYRLSDMMLPSFGNHGNHDQLIKQEKYPALTPESDPVLTHQLLGLNPAVETDKIDYPAQTDVTGPMRIRRIKRPIPAGPSYPVHLWQFILELLGDHSCKDFIAWTGNDLEFKVINSRELARRWGRRKNNARMNFDKLSRAMRYYYEKNIIKHIPGQRLVYRYCRNPDDIVFTQLLKTAMGTLPPETRLIAPVTTNPHFNNTHSLGGGFNPLSNGAPRSLSFSSASSSCSSLLQQSSPLQTHSSLQHSSLGNLSNGNMSNISLGSGSLATGSLGSGSLGTSNLGSGSLGSGNVGSGTNGQTSGLVSSTGLLSGPRPSDNNMTEYMFSANCLTQVQQHLQSNGEGVKQHHMMAS
ncbi:uncharacterized protein LOC134813711 isoform X2 [Bolinopsis microptera]|uniref:uncharacterized protein LOC134813711 isoform X2 n=1 Tax=Bolinopsis microptera TaxID=2820187 RepID=UPI0030793B80